MKNVLKSKERSRNCKNLPTMKNQADFKETPAGVQETTCLCKNSSGLGTAERRNNFVFLPKMFKNRFFEESLAPLCLLIPEQPVHYLRI
jgi:hypothetical protein